MPSDRRVIRKHASNKNRTEQRPDGTEPLLLSGTALKRGGTPPAEQSRVRSYGFT
ncbi:hypothetical protein QJQ58_20170 [Paenibacillus dendritiformis]|uniref:hypothetical protein n=1 Tax=Paenibacillus TaxID=44249 RepID=UPI00140817E0|nr:hypothetical protein [Paenibacillus dendritiformis]WGU92866.1 hypothetical protein QJQ58_20170 [Paenibacillus dendritiformis]